METEQIEYFDHILNLFVDGNEEQAKELFDDLMSDDKDNCLAHFDALLWYDVCDNGEQGQEDFQYLINTLKGNQ